MNVQPSADTIDRIYMYIPKLPREESKFMSDINNPVRVDELSNPCTAKHD